MLHTTGMTFALGLSEDPGASVAARCNQRRSRSCSYCCASSAKWKLLLLACCSVVLWTGDGSALPERGRTPTSSQRSRRRDTSGKGQANALGASSSSSKGMDARSRRFVKAEVGVGRGPSREQTNTAGMMAPTSGLEEEEEEGQDVCDAESSEDSCEDYDTEEAMGDGWEGGDSNSSYSDEERDQYDDDTTFDGDDSQQSDDEPFSDDADSADGAEGDLEQGQPYHLTDDYQNNVNQHKSRQGGAKEEEEEEENNSVRVCVLTWNLAEESPPSRDVEFLKEAAKDSDLVAVGVQEIENLKPRRNEGGRTREWRRLLIR